MPYSKIDIDLELYKAIEAHRLSFDEPPADIVKRQFGLNGPTTRFVPRVRRTRAGGNYSLTVAGEEFKVRSLREALQSALIKLEDLKPGFLMRLSELKTARGRRIVSRDPSAIYPRNPQLAHHAARLSDEWWFDTNVSRGTCRRYLGHMSRVSGIKDINLEIDDSD